MNTHRRFRVWLGKQVTGVDTVECVICVPLSATDAECERACQSALDDMIGSELDTGWEELRVKGPSDAEE